MFVDLTRYDSSCTFNKGSLLFSTLVGSIPLYIGSRYTRWRSADLGWDGMAQDGLAFSHLKTAI